MIFKKLCELLTPCAYSLLRDALLRPSILQSKRISLIPLYGVTKFEIDEVETLLEINNFESQLSSSCPYCTIMSNVDSVATLSRNWLSFPGGVDINELSIQELSAGRITPGDEFLLIQIILKLPVNQRLLIRNL